MRLFCALRQIDMCWSEPAKGDFSTNDLRRSHYTASPVLRPTYNYSLPIVVVGQVIVLEEYAQFNLTSEV